MQKLTFAQRYVIASFVVMFVGMLIIGAWVARLIEEGVANRTAAVTALYVDSYVAPYLQELTVQDTLHEQNIAFFDRLLSENALGRQIQSFKIWSTDGTILYSQEPSQIGEQHAIEAGLAKALAGTVYTELSQLEKEENTVERELSSEFIETYAPVRAFDSDEVIAASEFYQSADELRLDIRAAQIRSWLVVAGVMLAVYLLLAGIVGRASNVIKKQQAALQENVNQLNLLLTQNQDLHERSRRAAAHSTDLNERYLRRISADLHDGPAQDLALALLHMEALAHPADIIGVGPVGTMEGNIKPARTQIIRESVETALSQLRDISAGLRLPQIRQATISETVSRSVRDYEQKTGSSVTLTIENIPDEAPMSTKIALYRVVKEALNNGYRHARGAQQHVSISVQGKLLCVDIEDDGPGFDPKTVDTNEHLGVISMSERVEMLGGEFKVVSAVGQGTKVSAALPFEKKEEGHE